ncbi:hypothetical protein KFU94_12655 [Chloroflexi bacterium TSY]|nr:hypothetical protein [Chloroflexi bacterium TSY]
MMEALVEPGALQVFKDRGFDVHQIFPRVKGRQNGSIMEIDLLLTNTDELVFVEVKSTLRVADVDEALEDLAEFPRFFPTYADYRIYGAVAGLTIEENADRYAYKNGLFVIAVTGDNMVEILNDAK